MILLEQAYLKTLFTYDHETGLLFWKERPSSHFKTSPAHKTWNTRFSNKKAGRTQHGYTVVRVNSTDYKAHRLIWILANGRQPVEIDHINRNKGDNRLENLRSVTHSENCKNRLTEKPVGVTWQSNMNKWRARIWDEGKQIDLGLFTEFADAMKVRKIAEKELGYIGVAA